MMTGFIVGAAVVVGSLSTSIIHLSISLTLAGVGLGIPTVLTMAAVGQRFTTNYATAVGISKSGSSIAMLTLVPLIQLFLDTYGWRGTMMLIGGLSFHLVVCGALMVVVDKNLPHTHAYIAMEQNEDHSENDVTSRCGTFWKYVTHNLDLKLLRNMCYWAAAAIYCVNYTVFDMWIIFFVSMAQSKGFSPEDAAIFVTVAGVFNLISKLIQGYLIDRVFRSCWAPLCVMTIVSSAMLIATPWLNSYWLLMTSSSIFMFCIGITTCLQDVLFKQIFGAELLSGIFGWFGIKLTILRLCVEFIPGWFYDMSGTFNEAFIFIGTAAAVPLIPLVAYRYFKIV
ncbi:monocarboxylate transporter 12-like isoform X2 [Asterias amurensis]